MDRSPRDFESRATGGRIGSYGGPLVYIPLLSVSAAPHYTDVNRWCSIEPLQNRYSRPPPVPPGGHQCATRRAPRVTG